MTSFQRRLITSSAAVLAAVPLALVAAGPVQAADTFTCTSGATIFGAEPNGNLRRYSYTSPGTTTNTTGTAHGIIGSGWNGFGRLLGGPDGKVYGINSTGVHRYRWNGSGWDSINGGQSEKISEGFTEFASAASRNKITVDSIGDFYTVDTGGKLRWSRYDEQTKTWPVLNRVLDTGWDRYNLIVAGGPGVLYARDAGSGFLYRHRFEAISQRWISQNVLMGNGWGMFGRGIFSVGGDTLFGIQDNGDLNHYRWRTDEPTWPVGGTRFGVGWQTFANVFAITNTCRITEQDVPPRTAIAVQPFAPTAVMQGPATGTALAPIEYVYADNIGRLRYGRQADPDIFRAEWSTIGTDEAFTGKPALVQSGQGNLQVLAHSIATDVWSFTRTVTPTSGWQAGQNLAGIMGGRPVAARLSDNTTVVFATDDQRSLWFRSQDGPTGDQLPWRRLAGPSLNDLVVVPGADRSATLFANDASGLPVTATYRDAGLSSWSPLGGITPTGPLAVVTMPGRILRVFARTADGQIHTQLQSSAGGAFPGRWKPVGTFAAAGPPAAVLDPVEGRLVVVARGVDNEIYRVFETAQGTGAWGDWGRLNDEASDPAVTEPTIAEFTGSSGQSYLIVFRNQNDATRIYTLRMPSAGLARGADRAVPRFVAHTLPAPPG